MNNYKFRIIRITPSPIRSETINVGILVIGPSGPDIRLIESEKKIKAITTCYGLENLEKARIQIETMLNLGADIEQVSHFFQGSFCLSTPGTFTAYNELDYEAKINELNRMYISPEKSNKTSKVSQKRIITELKDKFESNGLMGKSIQDIYQHKVVQGYPLSEPEGLYAELLLKNGIYHLTETLDLRGQNNRQKMGDSAFKAVTMDAAKSKWEKEVKTFVVYAADSNQEKSNFKQLNLISSYADNMYNLLSDEDMSQYYDHMFVAAGKSLDFH